MTIDGHIEFDAVAIDFFMRWPSRTGMHIFGRLLGGTIVNRTYRTHKKQYVSLLPRQYLVLFTTVPRNRGGGCTEVAKLHIREYSQTVCAFVSDVVSDVNVR